MTYLCPDQDCRATIDRINGTGKFICHSCGRVWSQEDVGNEPDKGESE